MSIRRVCISGPGSVAVEEVELAPPGPSEVTVKMLHAGICGSDLHTYRRGHPWLDYPIRPGHEVSGVVVAAGEEVSGVELGSVVYVNPVLSCGVCPYCREGRTNLCDRIVGVGSHVPGGMAEAFNVASRAVLAAPAGVSALAASLIEPAATAVRALRCTGRLDGRPVAVIGASTIGLLTLGMAAEAGAPSIVATDLVAGKRRRALAWGASAAIDGRAGAGAGAGDLAEQIGEACGGRPAVVFDCVGSPLTFALAMRAVAKGGQVVVVGAEHGEAALALELVQDGEVTVSGCAMYTAGDVAAAERHVAANCERIAGLVSEQLPVIEAAGAFEVASSGEGFKVQLAGDGAAAPAATLPPDGAR